MNLNSIWSALEELYNRFNGISFEGSLNTIVELNLPSDWFIWLVAVMFFSAVRRMVQADLDVASQLRPVPGRTRLLSYLHRIADASFAAPEPTSKFIISYKRKQMHPGQVASVNVLTVQYLNELEGYRTDAHSAARMANDVAGHAWDAFSHLWRNGVSTHDQMYEMFQYNDVPKEVYAKDLLELAMQGWVREEEGKEIRNDAEVLTDIYFLAPWSCLTEADLEDLAYLAVLLPMA